MSRKIEVALVVKPQGIKGELKLKPLGDGASGLIGLKEVFLSKDAESPVSVTKSWRYKDNAFMALNGVTTRNDAEALRGKKLYIDVGDGGGLEEGVYYVADLIGCAIAGRTGKTLGTLKQVLQNGAADVYVVSGEKSFMMPALKRVIMSTDIEKKLITVDEEALAEVAVYED
jgi:16S rRNA processing protein RimM